MGRMTTRAQLKVSRGRCVLPPTVLRHPSLSAPASNGRIVALRGSGMPQRGSSRELYGLEGALGRILPRMTQP